MSRAHAAIEALRAWTPEVDGWIIAIGALAIGRLSIGSARIKKLQIDELEVGKLTVSELVKPGPE